MAVSLSDFTKTFQYVTTKSGPVVPARTTTVDMMKGTLAPVGDQTKEKVDHRTYKNRNLEMKKNYLSLRDIGVKVMTEATSTTSYSPMRLNLAGMDMDNTSLNGSFICDGTPVTINLKYPNKNNNISVELALEGGATMLYEVPLESDQFKGNFAQSIRESARNLIKQNNEPEDLDEMLYGVGAIPTMKDNFNDTLGIANSDTNNITAYESVDWKLQKLLNVCNDTVAMFEADDDMGGDAGGDFGAADFAAPADGGAPAGGDTGGDMGAPQDAGDVNGVTDGNGKGDDMIEFREFCLPSDPENGSGLSQAAWDNMAQIVSDAINYINDNQAGGVKPSANEWYEGFPGVKNMIPEEILEQFLSFDDYKALDTSLPKKGLQQFAHALEGGKIDITKFKTDLGKWFPDVYNTDGTAMSDVSKETAAMTFPADDQTGVGQGLDMNSTMDFSGFGGFNDTEGMMDQANAMVGNGNTDPGIDMSEGGSSSEEGGKDKTDIAIDSLDNLF